MGGGWGRTGSEWIWGRENQRKRRLGDLRCHNGRLSPCGTNGGNQGGDQPAARLAVHQQCLRLPGHQGGVTAKILWRCSVRLPDWRSPNVDSIDFSTFVHGYSTNFLPADFYKTYSA